MRLFKSVAAAAAIVLMSGTGAFACEYMKSEQSLTEAAPVAPQQTAETTQPTPTTGASTDSKPAEVATAPAPPAKTN